MRSMTICGKKLAVAAIAVMGFGLTAMPVLAQDTTAPATAQHDHGMHGQERQEHHLEMMTKKLNLSADQVSQIKAIQTDTMNQAMALHQDTSMAAADKHAKMKSIHEDAQTKIRAVLNDDQKIKFDAMEAKMKEHHGGHGHDGAQAPPPSQN